MRLGMEKPHSLSIRRYEVLLIDLHEYLESFPGATLNDKTSLTDLNEILLRIMHTSWYRQAYIQGFDFESIT